MSVRYPFTIGNSQLAIHNYWGDSMKKKLLLMPILVLAGIMLLVGPAAAQENLPVEATVIVPDGELAVGDPIELAISVTHPADYHIIMPELDKNWGDFVVMSQSPPATVSNDDGTETTTQIVDARLFSPGAFDTVPLVLAATDGAGQIAEVTAPPATVNIASILVEGDSELRDIKPQAELPFVSLWPWLVAGTLAALMIGAFVWFRRRKRLSVVEADPRLPYEVALDELARIQHLGLPAGGRYKEHYTLVSDCTRLYVEKTYGFPVLERTTGEIQAGLKATAVRTDVARRFVDLLDESDLVKFSKFKPDVASAQRLLAEARWIVEETRPVIVEEPAGNGSKISGGSQIANHQSEAYRDLALNGKNQHTEVSA
jgi:hypothetical protein